MRFTQLAFWFEVVLYIGLGLPLLSVIFNLIGGVGHSASGANADFDADIGADINPDADIDFDADAPDMQIPAAESGTPSADVGHSGGFPLRFNLYCLCLSFVVMGAIGLFALNNLVGIAQIVVLFGGFVLALAAYILLYRFLILPLKRNNAAALSLNSLRFKHVRVVFRITRATPGKIETRDATGARISYIACLDPDICKVDHFDEGEEVIVSEVKRDEGICYVTTVQNKLIS